MMPMRQGAHSFGFVCFYIFVVVAGSESFRINTVELQQGMGLEFRSSLYDGVRFGQASAPPTTASDRLQFVLHVLESMRVSKGSLPYEFDGSNVVNCSAFSDSIENVVKFVMLISLSHRLGYSWKCRK